MLLPCTCSVGLREVLVFKTAAERDSNTAPLFYCRLLVIDALLRFSWLLTACSLCVRFQPAQRYGLSYLLTGWAGMPLGHEVVLLSLAVAEVVRRALWTCARIERALLFQLALISNMHHSKSLHPEPDLLEAPVTHVDSTGSSPNKHNNQLLLWHLLYFYRRWLFATFRSALL